MPKNDPISNLQVLEALQNAGFQVEVNSPSRNIMSNSLNQYIRVGQPNNAAATWALSVHLTIRNDKVEKIHVRPNHLRARNLSGKAESLQKLVDLCQQEVQASIQSNKAADAIRANYEAWLAQAEKDFKDFEIPEDLRGPDRLRYHLFSSGLTSLTPGVYAVPSGLLRLRTLSASQVKALITFVRNVLPTL